MQHNLTMQQCKFCRFFVCTVFCKSQGLFEIKICFRIVFILFCTLAFITSSRQQKTHLNRDSELSCPKITFWNILVKTSFSLLNTISSYSFAMLLIVSFYCWQIADKISYTFLYIMQLLSFSLSINEIICGKQKKKYNFFFWFVQSLFLIEK